MVGTTRPEEAEDLITISREFFCGLLLLFPFSASWANENVTPADNPGEYLARAGDCVACHWFQAAKLLPGG
jgi:hypothetical protein